MTGDQSREISAGARACRGEYSNDRGAVTNKKLAWRNLQLGRSFQATRNSFHHFSEGNFMKRPKPKEAGTEIDCPACEGTGFPPVAQPEQAGRKIYPAPCEQCLGKGRIEAPRPQ
jgi:hypothetical protein